MSEHPFDRLGRELAAAAGRETIDRSTSRRGPRGVLLVAIAALLSLSVAAWATSTLLSSGAPVPYRYGAPPEPDRHYGTTVPGSVELLTDSVADPDGGLPWGLRTFTTSRGYGCIQVGRVQDGKLGVLALEQLGGGYAQRGRFHELRPAPVRQATNCIPLDGAGHAFLSLHLPSSTDVVPPQCAVRKTPSGGLTRCTGGTARTIDAGLLGPRARSITYRDDHGASVTKPTLGDAGGYLTVRRGVVNATRTRRLGGRDVAFVADGQFALSPASSVITGVAYRDAPPCTAHPSTRSAGSCFPAPGFTPVPQPKVADVRSPVRAFATANHRAVRIRFRARVAVRDGRSAYNVLLRFPRGGTTNALGVALDRDVAAGQLFHTTITIPNVGEDHRPAMRPGRYTVEVSYRVQPPRPRLTGSLAYPGYIVGRASFTVR